MYDAVEFFVSTWEKGNRYEERLTGRDELEAAGLLRDPVVGKVRVGSPLNKSLQTPFPSCGRRKHTTKYTTVRR